MNSKWAIIRQTVILAVAISIVPLILYPATFGLPNLNLHPLYAFGEWALYFLLYLVLQVRLSVGHKLMAAGGTVLFRISVGLVLAGLVSVMQTIPLKESIPECLWQYPPAVVLHVAFAPFLLMPLLNRSWVRRSRFAIDSNRARPAAPPQTRGFSFPEKTPPAKPVLEADELSFDAATAWLGDYVGVRVAVIADTKGLVVAYWSSANERTEAEYWAATAVEVVRYHGQFTPQQGEAGIDRLEVESDLGHLIIRAAGPFWLAVLATPETGELINLRVGQAVEMITKHYQHRYRTAQPAGLEVSHV